MLYKLLQNTCEISGLVAHYATGKAIYYTV